MAEAGRPPSSAAPSVLPQIHGVHQDAEAQQDHQVGHIGEPPRLRPAGGVVIVLDDPSLALAVDKLVQVVIEHIEVGQVVLQGRGVLPLPPQSQSEHIVLHGEVLHLLLLKEQADLIISGVIRGSTSKTDNLTENGGLIASKVRMLDKDEIITVPNAPTYTYTSAAQGPSL